MILEESCDKCGGKGWYQEDILPITCESCEGTGSVITEKGKEILLFVRKHLGLDK